jgi:hypothetical protein
VELAEQNSTARSRRRPTPSGTPELSRNRVALRCYDIYGIRLTSVIPLRSLRLEVGGAANSLELRFGTAPTHDTPIETFFEGSGCFCGKGRNGYILRFPNSCGFEIDWSGREISGNPSADHDALFEHALLDHVIPRVLHLHGRPALHASAVEIDGCAVAFVGESGRGKSTLAASFGLPLVTDDCLALSIGPRDLMAELAYPSLRLYADSTKAASAEDRVLARVSPWNAKLRVSATAAKARLPLRRVYVLEEAPLAPAVESLGFHEAIAELARHVHRLDPTKKEALIAELDLLDRIASRSMVRRLRYPRRFEDLPAVHALIAADLRDPRS